MINSSELNRKQQTNLNFFWLGFILYSLTYALSPTVRIIILFCQSIQFLGLILIVITSINLIHFKLESIYLKFFYILYCSWLFLILLKGYTYFNFSFFKSFFLGNPFGGMLYFTPLILLFPKDFVFLKKMFQLICIFGFFFILYDIIFIKNLLNSDSSSKRSMEIVETLSTLSFSSGFILLTFFYHSKKRQLFAAVVVLLALLFAIIRARRGLILMYSEIILFSYLLYVMQSRKKLLVVYISIFATLIGAFYFSRVYKPLNNRIYGFLLSRGEEDSRTGVELYFYDDMKPKDWVVGRGIKGEYFCPDIEEDQVTNYRETIETGYLQTILNGGLISLGLFLLIAFPAIIKGIFFSENMLSKAAGIWILMSIINSYPATVNAFTLGYLLVWISIGICYSDKIRRMSETEVWEIFQMQTSV